MTLEERAINAAMTASNRQASVEKKLNHDSATFIREQYIAAAKAGLEKIHEWFTSMGLRAAGTPISIRSKSHYSFMPWDQQPARADGYTVLMYMAIHFEWSIDSRTFIGNYIHEVSIPFALQSGQGFNRQTYMNPGSGLTVEVLVEDNTGQVVHKQANTLLELGNALTRK